MDEFRSFVHDQIDLLEEDEIDSAQFLKYLEEYMKDNWLLEDEEEYMEDNWLL